MLTANQKEQIAKHITNFKQCARTYLDTKEKFDMCQKSIEEQNNRLSDVTKEDRQMELAVDVLYKQTVGIPKAKEIQELISNLKEMCNHHSDELNTLKKEITELMKNLPIPVDLSKPEQQNSDFSFPYFENLELGEVTITVLSQLLRQEMPLKFDDVVILPSRISIKNTADKQEAIQKLVTAIQNFRIRVDILSESYEKIDALIDRITNSKFYPFILLTIADNEKLNAQEIAKILNVDERTIYDSCYNLTRDNWIPNPIQKLPSGEWALTFAGQILVERLLEKNPELKTKIISKESVE